MKITFGMIVCNGDDFLAECLESIYPFAHAICIAEGATRDCLEAYHWDSPRSRDRTLEIIQTIPDADRKIALTQGGPYQDKNDQCNAYLSSVPPDTDYLWMIDADETYLPEDVVAMEELLAAHEPTCVTVLADHFFKSPRWAACGPGWDDPVTRIFRWYPDCRWVGHRPPSLLHHWTLLNQVKPYYSSVRMKHYGYMTEKQVHNKLTCYSYYLHRDYLADWFRPVWVPWSEETRQEIESRYSIHPSVPDGKTRAYGGPHPEAFARRFGW